MGIKSWFDKRATKKSGGNPQSPTYWVEKLFGGLGNTAAGINVDENSALSSTAVWRAVSIVSQTIGALPLSLYERDGENTRRKATEHYLYYPLHTEPNPEQTSMEFREMLQAHALTWGRAHAEIITTPRGGIQLWPLTPDRVEPIRNKNGLLLYKVYLPDGGHKVLMADEVFTLRGLGYGINTSYNVIQLFRESIGLTLAAEEFGARFFGNGATMGGVLEHPGELGDEEYKLLKQSMAERHQGLSQAHRLLILEEGMKYKEISVPPDKAQFLETRTFQINDVARIIGVPPHKLSEMSKATFSNIEEQSLEFIQDTINPWCVRWEQGLARQLLSEIDKKKYYWKHNLAGLLRGDFKTRMEGYSVGRQNGWLSANDIRELEDMNPIPNGDIYLVPLNMVPAEQVANPPVGTNRSTRETRAAKSEKARVRLFDVYKPLIKNAASEIIARERADVMREAEKDFKKRNMVFFNEWLQEFYESHKDFIDKKMAPVIMSYSKAMHGAATEEIGVDDEFSERHTGFAYVYMETYTKKHIARSMSRLQEASKKEDPIAALNEEFDQWEESRVDGIANEESVKAGNAFTKVAWQIAGVTKLIWKTNAGACEFCRSLDGKVVGIQEVFAKDGESISSITGNKPPMTVTGNVGGPPVHQGCTCTIMPGF